MEIYEKQIVIPVKKTEENLIDYFQTQISKNLKRYEIPIRFAVTNTDNKYYYCEVGIISDKENVFMDNDSIFDFVKRPCENTDKFNVVLVVPTGIDAELGGHSGDAGALAKYFASECDTLITHPNVVNASDINELPENGLYVEGSILSRFLMGTVGLQRVRSNRLEVVLQKHENKYFTDAAINTVSSARVSLGVDAKVLIFEDNYTMESKYTSSGRAVGIIKNMNSLLEELNSRKKEFDAVALSSIIKVDPKFHKDYYLKDMVNPWGGVEAMLTHTISPYLNVPSAHSPMLESIDLLYLELGIVDPRKAAEVVSTTFLYSVLKGLHKSPKIITDKDLVYNNKIFNASDVSCLVLPDKCIGLPTLAALYQNIHVIAVKENKNLMRNNLENLPWSHNQLTIVENYHEAMGIIFCLRSGVHPESVRRPLEYTKVLQSTT